MENLNTDSIVSLTKKRDYWEHFIFHPKYSFERWYEHLEKKKKT